MKATLSHPDVFKQVGLDFASYLLGITFVLDKRPNGQPIIKLSSNAPINEPFVDMLLELNWATGRLIREYTFLLDPPELTAKSSVPSPVSSPKIESSTLAKAPVGKDRDGKGIFIDLRTKPAEKPIRPAEKPTGKSAEAAAAKPATASTAARTLEVKQGDTLYKIAKANTPQGVSLDQMLVGFLRTNQDAFDGGNIHRIKSGKILVIPEKSTLDTIDLEEAKKLLLAQLSDWNAYRNRLAGIAVKEPVAKTEPGHSSSGKITTRLEEKSAPATMPANQVKVSKSETVAASKLGVAGKQSEENRIAHEKALQDANERVAALEKNLANLQKLLELKSVALTDLQKQFDEKVRAEKTQAAQPAPATSLTPAPEAAKPAAVPAATTPAPAPTQPAEPAPAAPQKPAEIKKPKPVIPPPPPPPENSFFEDMLEDPLVLGGAGGILALLAAGGYIMVRRRRAAQENEVVFEAENTSLSPQKNIRDSIQPDNKPASAPANQANSKSSMAPSFSIARGMGAGAHSVDTSMVSLQQQDFSQAGPGSIDTDEVDPVAEADVYMAYGRDAQAEEILIEAKSKEGCRHAVYLKLMEIYLNRKDAAAFSAVMLELEQATGATGADWEKAVAMKLKLTPNESLSGNNPNSILSSRFNSVRATDDNHSVPPPKNEMAGLNFVSSSASKPGTKGSDYLDFDLNQAMDKPAAPEPTPVAPAKQAAPAVAPTTLDFDLGDLTKASPATPAADAKNSVLAPAQQGAADTSNSLDFDFSLDLPASSESSITASPTPSFVTDSSSSMPIHPAFDMSKIDLNLDTPAAPKSKSNADNDINTMFATSDDEVMELVSAEIDDSPGQVATKLELAKAYEEMGDHEGARELLEEVVKEGNAAQREKAQASLAKLNA